MGHRLPKTCDQRANRGWAFVATSILLAVPAASDPAYTPPPIQHVEMIKQRFAPLQQLSFAAGYEYCGYLCMGADDALVFTEIVRGGHNGCTPEMPRDDLTLIASMHTHGAYDPSVPAEFPTALDMESDRAEGVNGYIATPGGRLWYVDSQAMVVVQLCGIGCLPQDPAFHQGDDGQIATIYTHADLLQIESQ